jgi:hypothetical protein
MKMKNIVKSIIYSFLILSSQIGSAQLVPLTIEGKLLTPAGDVFSYPDMQYDVVIQTATETISIMDLSSCSTNSTIYRLCFEVEQSILNDLPNMTVDPKLDVDPLNGVSTLDLVLTMRHILGIDPATEAYQILGADVTDDRRISAFDIVKSRQVILGQILTFDGPAWRFVEQGKYDAINVLDFTTPDVSTPAIIYQSGVNTYSDLDFVVIKTGDLNLTFVPR